MVPDLPLEVQQLIITLLELDIHTLASCSLVSHSWLPTARSSLFRNVILGPTREDFPHASERISGLLDFLRSSTSTFPRYVTRLEIREKDSFGVVDIDDESVPWVDQAVHTLIQLENVSTLCLRGVRWQLLSLDARQAFRDGFKRVTALEFVHWHSTTSQDFREFVASFPELSVLDIGSADWKIHRPEHRALLISPPKLHSFTIRSTHKSAIFEWFVNAKEAPKTSTVHLYAIQITKERASSWMVGSYLRALGPSLTELLLQFVYPANQDIGDLIKQRVDLKDNTRLRTLILDCRYTLLRSLKWILDVIHMLNSRSMDYIEIKLNLSDPVMLYNLEWIEVKEALQRSIFAGLRGVRCMVRPGRAVERIFEDSELEEQWPILRVDGELRVMTEFDGREVWS